MVWLFDLDHSMRFYQSYYGNCYGLWYSPVPQLFGYVVRQLYANTTRETGRVAMLGTKFLSMSDIELVLVQMWSWSCSKDAASSFLFAVKESRTPECLCLSICVTSRNLTLPTFRKTFFFWLAIQTAGRTLASRLTERMGITQCSPVPYNLWVWGCSLMHMRYCGYRFGTCWDQLRLMLGDVIGGYVVSYVVLDWMVLWQY